jgi:hypothetical protein
VSNDFFDDFDLAAEIEEDRVTYFVDVLSKDAARDGFKGFANMDAKELRAYTVKAMGYSSSKRCKEALARTKEEPQL